MMKKRISHCILSIIIRRIKFELAYNLVTAQLEKNVPITKGLNLMNGISFYVHSSPVFKFNEPKLHYKFPKFPPNLKCTLSSFNCYISCRNVPPVRIFPEFQYIFHLSILLSRIHIYMACDI